MAGRRCALAVRAQVREMARPRRVVLSNVVTSGHPSNHPAADRRRPARPEQRRHFASRGVFLARLQSRRGAFRRGAGGDLDPRRRFRSHAQRRRRRFYRALCRPLFHVHRDALRDQLGLRQSSRKLGGYAWDRFLRIYLPFICWTALYLGFKFVQMRVLPNSAARAGEGFSLGAWILWDGGSYHLWFLPYICLMTVLAFGVGKLLVSRPQLNWPIIVAGSVGGIVWAIAPTPYAASDTLVLRFGWNTMPAALWAIALRGASEHSSTNAVQGTAWLIAGLWITITSIAAQCMPAPHLLLQTSLAWAGRSSACPTFGAKLSTCFKSSARSRTACTCSTSCPWASSARRRIVYTWRSAASASRSSRCFSSRSPVLSCPCS